MIADLAYFSQDGGRWASRQIASHRLTSGNEKYLLIVLAAHADVDGSARPSHERLAELAGQTTRSVERSMKKFRSLGIISQQKYRSGRFWVTEYALNQWDMAASDYKFPEYKTTRLRFEPDSTGTKESGSRNKNAQKVLFGPDSGVFKESGKDSIEDSREERVHGFAFGPEDALPDWPAQAPTTPPPVAGNNPARRSRGGRQQIDHWLHIWELACSTSKLIKIDRPLTKAETIALTQANKHPALAKDDDAWRRYCRWVRDDPFLSGQQEGGYPANLQQVLKATVIDRWATQDQGPPPPRDPEPASGILEFYTSPPKSVPNVIPPLPPGAMTAAERREDPVLRAAIRVLHQEQAASLRQAMEAAKAAGRLPGAVNGHARNYPPSARSEGPDT